MVVFRSNEEGLPLETERFSDAKRVDGQLGAPTERKVALYSTISVNDQQN